MVSTRSLTGGRLGSEIRLIDRCGGRDVVENPVSRFSVAISFCISHGKKGSGRGDEIALRLQPAPSSDRRRGNLIDPSLLTERGDGGGRGGVVI